MDARYADLAADGRDNGRRMGPRTGHKERPLRDSLFWKREELMVAIETDV
jgi:hypothetical protein